MQWIWLAAGALLLAGAAQLQAPLDELSRHYELIPPGTSVHAEHPELALLTVAPGGLRALLVNYFWIRSQNLHQEGRHFDAMQLAEIICSLQPRFPAVWGFQSWQMAWNISASTHTPAERWHWVSRGIKLLRDRGIPLNPTALMLYKDLSWIFSSKMGDRMDDMHMVYKQRWAWQMQRLLGAPRYASSPEILADFKPIADAPLDKDTGKQGRTDIQADRRRQLLADNPAAADYAEKLAKLGVGIDESLLEAYNRFTRDDQVAMTRRPGPVKVASEHDAELYALINAPRHADARAALLAFVRAQILWNRYRMDPQYMYRLMADIGPIDWRLVWAHGLYWSAYGTEHCTDLTRAEIDFINTDRTTLNCVKNMTWFGRMTYVENARDPESPYIQFRSDWQFVEAAHKEYARLGEELASARGEGFDKNAYIDGHINYLINAINMLFNGGRYEQGRYYMNWIREHYKKSGGIWDTDDVEEFVYYQLGADREPIPRVAVNQITSSLQMAFVFLAAGNEREFQRRLKYARRVYNAYHEHSARRQDRLRLRPIPEIAANILAELLVRPKLAGFNISLVDRSAMYRRVQRRWPAAAPGAYERSRAPLERQCLAEGLDFETLFPAPEGLEEFRRQRDRAIGPLRLQRSR